MNVQQKTKTTNIWLLRFYYCTKFWIVPTWSINYCKQNYKKSCHRLKILEAEKMPYQCKVDD